MAEANLDRRSLIAAGAVLAAARAVPAAAGQGASPAGPMPLPFDPAKVGWLSEKLLVSHHDNNYAGAVKRLGAIRGEWAKLDMATAPGFVLNGLKREELMAWNSAILHELYFDCLGGEGEPKGALADQMARDFGSTARWKAEFVATGKALGGGSGWVLLTWCPRDKRLANQWASDHTQTLAGATPILALDMYEHAYQMDFGAAAAKYVDGFMNALSWGNASRLFAKL